MFSPLLSKLNVPESIWLPPEIRSLIEPEDHSPSSTVPHRVLLGQKLDILLDRIDHIETVIDRLDMENRLRRLEEQVVINIQTNPTLKKTKHRGG